MEDKKTIVAEKKTLLGMRLWLGAIGVALLALVVYALTFAGSVFPGASTHLFTQWMGMNALPQPTSPIWGRFVRFVGELTVPSSMAVRMNLFSLVCGVLASGLVSLLVGFFVKRTIRQEESLRFREGAALAGALVAGCVFIFSPSVWRSSTHLEVHIFDVCLALLLFTGFIPMARGGKRVVLWAIALGIGEGIGFVESPIFAPLGPVFLLAVVVSAMKSGKKPYLPAVLFVAASAISYVVTANVVALSYLQLPAATMGNMHSPMDVTLRCVSDHIHEISAWVRRPGWLYVILFAVLPFVACMFASPRGLNNERSWSQYLFHAAMTVCTLLAVATPLAPESLMRPFGIEPVATSALVAVVAGYLTAYWLVLFRTAPVAREGSELSSEVKLGGRMAPVVLGIFLVLVALATLVNTFGMSRGRGDFADICANEVVERMGARTWLVTDGVLDDHLRIVAASRGKELNLVCLQRDMEEAYLRELGALAKEKKLSGGAADLGLSIELGVLPFLQDWFGGDSKVNEKVAVFGVPDLWYMAKAKPVPEALFFGGARELEKEVDPAKAVADFMAFWKKMENVLTCDKGKGSREIGKSRDPLDALRLHLRRHVGFVANNLGVMLQDLKKDKEAFALYELVLKTIDPDNISALFNEFEMARANVPEAVARKKEITASLKAIVDDPTRRYALWSLARYYGYIRSADIFARMGYRWAHSAMPGNAISHLQHARDLVAGDRQAELIAMLADAYASDNQTKKSRELYEEILSGDTENRDARMGLVRLALKNGDVKEALKQLELAVKGAKNAETSGFDKALLLMLKNDLDSARLSLQKVTDLNPKSLQGWSLLAGVLLQQLDQAKDDKARKGILSELETVILPKMQTIAGSPQNYYVQMTRALILLRKGPEFRKEARDALVVAAEARPDISTVGDMILNLDVQMADTEGTEIVERHARMILRQNRRSKLANYLMGSIRLQRGDYATAETFLRLSTDDEHPMPTALNDLAEVLRRQKKYADAEKAAREAVKLAPNLYVAWETLASLLLDQKKNLAEAEECVNKAIEISKKVVPEGDVRMRITLARVQLAKGDIVHFNTTIRSLNNAFKQLEKHDQEAVEELQKAARSKTR